MTSREVSKRNNLSFLLVGIVFAALGIYDWSIGKSVVGILFTVSGAIAVAQVLQKAIPHKNGKNG